MFNQADLILNNMTYKLFTIGICASLVFASCNNTKKQEVSNEPATTLSGLSISAFDGDINGKANTLYVMKNAKGMEVCVTNFGARIVSIMVPDKNNEMKDVVLGFDNKDGYVNNKSDFGAAIGRYGNRIAEGKFSLDGVDFQLPLNNGLNSLHGGTTGFQYQMFDITQVDSTTLECRYLSPDGDNGYPGNLNVKVTYKLTEANALDISYEAETDKKTIINLTNHSYFNLSGNANNTVLDHVVYMDCGTYTPVNENMIPTGKIETVAGTPMDFTKAMAIGDRINDTTFLQLKLAGGYDHNWIFNKSGDINNVVCKVVCPATGISLKVYTIEPAVQFYTGNFLDGTLKGKKGITYNQRTGFCLETQHYPDSPNHANFPSTVLSPGEKYTSKCVYEFGVEI